MVDVKLVSFLDRKLTKFLINFLPETLKSFTEVQILPKASSASRKKSLLVRICTNVKYFILVTCHHNAN
jgi:hypothetical protein